LDILLDTLIPPSQQYLGQEIANILSVCNMLGESPPKDDLSLETIRMFNAAVLDKLELEEGVVPGVYRTPSVIVGSVYQGAPAQDCEYLIDRFCEWLKGPAFEAPEELSIVYAVIKAIVARLYLAWIHPFGDGNGRTARLVEFRILSRNLLCKTITDFHLVSRKDQLCV
jgi:Fic family protein